ncbi:MAG: MmgE/PrpD family protein, partial [Pseudomonadota bacterium]
VVDPDNEYPANYTGHVRATLADGAVRETRAPCLRGGAKAPLSREDLIAKCSANLRFAGRDGAAADQLAAWSDALMAADGAFDPTPLRRLGA